MTFLPLEIVVLARLAVTGLALPAPCASAAPAPERFVGVHVLEGFDRNPGAARQAVTSGSRFFTMGGRWNELEPRPGSYDHTLSRQATVKARQLRAPDAICCLSRHAGEG